jgi:hypothetical protein
MKEQVKNISNQLARFVSHMESEQRVTGNISKRVDQVWWILEHQDKNKKWRMETFIGIASLVSTLLIGVLMITKM